MLNSNLHTFVISAWNESPYIEETLQSLRTQRYPSKIIVATSSPNDFLEALCKKYQVDYRVNSKAHLADSAVNWTFAYEQANTPYVTLAHQDDIYLPEYSEQMIAAAIKHPENLLVFSRCANYCEGKITRFALLLLIKDILLLPYYLKRNIFSSRIRFATFAFGNPVCCPTVMFHKEKIGQFSFDPNVKVNLDWDAWLRLTSFKGCFLYCPETLILRRLHQKSGTTLTYQDGSRAKDDLLFFRKFWPEPIANVLTRLYNMAKYLN